MRPYFEEAWKRGDASAPRYTVNDAADGCRAYGSPTRINGRGNHNTLRQPHALRRGKSRRARRAHNRRARAVLKRDTAARAEERP